MNDNEPIAEYIAEKDRQITSLQELATQLESSQDAMAGYLCGQLMAELHSCKDVRLKQV